MRGEAEIVVRRQVDNLAAIDRRAGRLIAVEDARVAVEALRLDGVELVAEERKGVDTSHAGRK
jgi:hypothetical protein